MPGVALQATVMLVYLVNLKIPMARLRGMGTVWSTASADLGGVFGIAGIADVLRGSRRRPAV